jgi:hypothetical protein
MKARVPHWPLDRVKQLVSEGKVFVQKTRALEFFATMEAAYLTVEATVSGLTTKAFAHSMQQTQDVCDVYGVLVEGDGWYLKICIDEGTPENAPEVAVVSFHPLERPLRTNSGEVKPKGWQEPARPKPRGGR